ncbi:MAG: hypothetical protein A2W31_06585 [Planctomycetes bacterium RBG_16_64_10]|nr:MAG: hypothetical protein A2W31_06585 [Planctomycetes bacterium RBG_16_64_10]
MATVYWKGGAAPVAQVDSVLVGGTIEAGDLFTITIGDKTLSVAAPDTSAANTATAIAAAWNALDSGDWPEFAEITAAGDATFLMLTADEPGVPFTVAVATTEANGAAADAQTFVRSADTACSGPNHWDTAANWSGGALPANTNDVVIENSDVDILYGLDQSALTFASLAVKQSYSGKIGLPRRNAGGYFEYRDQSLKCGATLVNIGDGDGQGSGRIKINTGTVAATITVFNAGTPTEYNDGIPAVLLQGSHAANALVVIKGDVGSAFFAAETAQYASIKTAYKDSPAGDVKLRCGSGVTHGTITQAGGVVEINSNATTVSQTEETATLWLKGAAAVTTLTAEGLVKSHSTGTIGTATIRGVFDKRGTMTAQTITNLTVTAGAEYHDPASLMTLTNGMILSQARPEEITLDIAAGKTLTIA